MISPQSHLHFHIACLFLSFPAYSITVSIPNLSPVKSLKFGACLTLSTLITFLFKTAGEVINLACLMWWSRGESDPCPNHVLKQLISYTIGSFRLGACQLHAFLSCSQSGRDATSRIIHHPFLREAGNPCILADLSYSPWTYRSAGARGVIRLRLSRYAVGESSESRMKGNNSSIVV